MNNKIRFELSFKNISQLENKLNFCKLNNIKNINIPCKGLIKKDLFNTTIKYISKNYKEFNVTYHYSLYHQYSKNKEKSYQDFLDFVKNSQINRNYKILLVSGSNKKKNFESVDVLAYLKKEKNLEVIKSPFKLVEAPEIGIGIAWRSKTRSISFSQSLNKISGDIICPYPPGIPLLVPGEKIDIDRFNWINNQSLCNKDLVNFNVRVLET